MSPAEHILKFSILDFLELDNLDVKRYSCHFSMTVVTIFKYGFTETF